LRVLDEAEYRGVFCRVTLCTLTSILLRKRTVMLRADLDRCDISSSLAPPLRVIDEAECRGVFCRVTVRTLASILLRKRAVLLGREFIARG